MLSRLSALYTRSPQENLARLAARFTSSSQAQSENINWVVPDFVARPVFARLAAHELRRIAPSANLAVLVGAADEVAPLAAELRSLGVQTECVVSPIGAQPLPRGAVMIICQVPVTADAWAKVAALKNKYGANLYGIQELTLRFAGPDYLLRVLPSFMPGLESYAPFWSGEKWFGPLDRLNTVFSLGGKRIIEYGPFEACQTAGLVHLGAFVTCIESRPENVAKVLAVRQAFDWEKQVKIICDDFHNADVSKYGRFDLAFAHGTYYHSVAPFVFLKNLVGLSDAVFVGGFCATDDSPAGPWEELHDGKDTYRVKAYRESGGFTAGVNPIGYFFHSTDLQSWFARRGFAVTVIDDEASDVTAGRYVRILAQITDASRRG